MRGASVIVASAIVVFAAGCASSPPAAPPTPVTQQVKVPVITRQKETLERQPKAGLEITVVPVTYTPRVIEESTIEQAQRSFASEMWRTNQGADIYVRKTTSSTVQVEPNTLCFLVTVVNRMPRVFHGAGTVVQFNAGGKVLAVDQRGYSTLLGAIIPPQQQQQFTIVGPALSELTAPSGIIGVFLYDVPTGMSDAGVVTEKQNYQWYYDYAMTPQAIQVPATHAEEFNMPVAEFQKWQGERAAKQYLNAAGQAGMTPGQPYAPR